MEVDKPFRAVTVVCQDDDTAAPIEDVNIEWLKQCNTLKNFVEDCDDIDMVPVCNMKMVTMKKIIEYMSYHYEHPLTEEQKQSFDITAIPEWDLAYINVDDEMLADLFMSGNFLEYPELMRLCAKKYHIEFRKIIDQVGHEHAAEEIGRRFNIKCDIPDDLLAKIKVQNSFLIKALQSAQNSK